MRVFISSVIRGMEEYRDAVAGVCEDFRCEVDRSEALGAKPESSQIACLDIVRNANFVVLILGARYGTPQPSGLSATHEEYREACERCQVLAFVEDGVEREPRQAEFVREVESWSGGMATAHFRDATALRRAVTTALRDLEVDRASVRQDPDAALVRARGMAPSGRDSRGAVLSVLVVPTVSVSVLRPAKLDDPSFRASLKREALFGTAAFFDGSEGSKERIDGDSLRIEQPNGNAIVVTPDGAWQVTMPAVAPRDGRMAALPALIEEDVRDRIALGLRFLTARLDEVDRSEHIREVVPVVAIGGSSFLAWRTRTEHARSPNSMPLRMTGDPVPIVHLTPPNRTRGTLRQKQSELLDDFVTLLRRRLA